MMMIMLYSGNVFAGDAVLSWNPVADPNLAGYKIYYGTASGVYAHSFAVGQTATPSTPKYQVSNLPDGTTYYFAVKSYDGPGNESGFSNEVSKTLQPVTVPPPASTPPGSTPPPAMPPDTVPPMDITEFNLEPGDSQIRLSWTGPADPTFYGVRIRVRTDGIFPADHDDGDLVGDFPGQSQMSESYIHTNLQNGMTYYYAAFSYDAGNNFSHTVHASAMPASQSADPFGSSNSIIGGCGAIRNIHDGGNPPPWPMDLILLTAVMVWFGLLRRFKRSMCLVNNGT
jgi:hypothetical protein